MLAWAFPANENYAIDVEVSMAKRGKKNLKILADLVVYHYREEKENDKDKMVVIKIMVTECKRPSLEGQKLGFPKALEQLYEYGKSVGSSPNSSKPLYGIVAVGRFVEFYEWDREGKRWEMRPCSEGLSKPLKLATNHKEIAKELIYIREHH
jgi:hypothetical protein